MTATVQYCYQFTAVGFRSTTNLCYHLYRPLFRVVGNALYL